MPKASPSQVSFNAGEFSDRAEARTDLEKYGKGCRTLENFIPLVQGGALKRSGTRFVIEVKDSADETRLLEFTRSVAASYILELGNLYMRFYRNNAPIYNADQTITGATQADPVVITITGHPFSNGDTIRIESVGGMTELNDKRYLVANKTANDFELTDLAGVDIDGTAFTAYTTGGIAKSVAEVVTPYAPADLYDIQIAQSADVMYFTHPDYPPYKLSRTGDITFTMEEVVFDWPPLLDDNPDDSITLTPSAITGVGITVTASTDVFDSNHVGAYFEISELAEAKHDEWKTSTAYTANDTVIFEGNVYEAQNTASSGTRPPVHLSGTESDGVVDWLYLHSGSGYVEITAFASSTSVTATVISDLPASTTAGTFRWAEGAWSDFQGYPRAISFYETRLWFGGTAGAPNTMWASVTNSFEDFLTGEEDDDSLRYTINTDQVNTIQWMSPDKVMAIGTEGGEFIAHGNTLDEPITPSSVRITRQTGYGSKHIRPERSGASIIFVQRAGKRLREYLYNFDIDRYIATDLTVLSEHITINGIKDSCHQKEPNRVVWYVSNTGELFALTYEREQQVVGFHRHIIGGTDVLVKSIAAIPHPDRDVDQVWMIVERTINGSTVQYIEYMEKDFGLSAVLLDAVFLDSAIVTEGSDIDTVTGLEHLEGETIEGLIDGATVKPDQVVTNGSVTWPRTGDKIVVGLPYNATLETLRIEAGAADGTAQGKTKRIHNLTVRMVDTGPGMFIGPTTSKLDEVFFRSSEDMMDEAVPLFTGDKGPVLFPSGYEKPGRIVVRHSSPLPCTVLALMPQLHTQDR